MSALSGAVSLTVKFEKSPSGFSEMEGKCLAVNTQVQKNVRLRGNDAGLPVLFSDDVQNHRSAKLACVVGQREDYAWLSIQFALPHAEPLRTGLAIGPWPRRQP